MVTEPPNLMYYRAVEGRWRSRFEFRITNRRAFWANVRRWPDRLQLLALAILTRIPGSLVIETCVDCTTASTHREVVHTTRLAKWGLTLIRTREVITLDTNGRDFSMQLPTRIGTGMARGSVNETGTIAGYEIPFFGAVMHQTGHREGDVTRIVQETAFSRGEQRLRRVVSERS